MRALLPHLVPASSAFWMVALAVAEVAVFARGRIDFRVLRRHPWFFSVIGVLVGINTNLGFVAVRYVEPGTASLLSRTSILFGVALGVLWLRERLNRIETAGAVLAIAGAVAVSVQPGDHLRLGALIVVIATFLYALHSAVVKRYGGGVGSGIGLSIPIGSTSTTLPGNTFAVFSSAEAGPPPWRVRVKVSGLEPAVIVVGDARTPAR